MRYEQIIYNKYYTLLYSYAHTYLWVGTADDSLAQERDIFNMLSPEQNVLDLAYDFS